MLHKCFPHQLKWQYFIVMLMLVSTRLWSVHKLLRVCTLCIVKVWHLSAGGDVWWVHSVTDQPSNRLRVETAGRGKRLFPKASLLTMTQRRQGNKNNTNAKPYIADRCIPHLSDKRQTMAFGECVEYRPISPRIQTPPCIQFVHVFWSSVPIKTHNKTQQIFSYRI